MTELPDAIMNTPIGDSISRRWGSLWHLHSAAATGDSEARAWVEQPATMAQVYEAQPPSDYEGTALAQQPSSNQPPIGSMTSALRDYARDNAPTPVIRVRTRVEDIPTPAAAPAGFGLERKPPQPVEAGAPIDLNAPLEGVARSIFDRATTATPEQQRVIEEAQTATAEFGKNLARQFGAEALIGEGKSRLEGLVTRLGSGYSRLQPDTPTPKRLSTLPEDAQLGVLSDPGYQKWMNEQWALSQQAPMAMMKDAAFAFVDSYVDVDKLRDEIKKRAPNLTEDDWANFRKLARGIDVVLDLGTDVPTKILTGPGKAAKAATEIGGAAVAEIANLLGIPVQRGPQETPLSKFVEAFVNVYVGGWQALRTAVGVGKNIPEGVRLMSAVSAGFAAANAKMMGNTKNVARGSFRTSLSDEARTLQGDQP